MFMVEPGGLDGARPGDQVQLGGAEGRHAVQVRRVGVGERVDLADGAGVRAEGVVRQVSSGSAGQPAAVTLEVLSCEREPAPAVRFVLVQALAKADRDLAAVETATELGVDRIVPWQASRSIVVWRGERAAKAHKRWAATAFAASKQSRRARVPEVSDLVTTAELGPLAAQAALTVVLHESADRTLTAVDLPTEGEVLVVVGPEGGISEPELGTLVAAGAIAVRLGPTVLRSSSAGPAALAVLSARARWA
jgi:16S rRNA (uracil1498-N3)-methyltransferase